MSDLDTLHEHLNQAHAELVSADQQLATTSPRVAELDVAVRGAVATSTALADLVTTLIRQAPRTLGHTHPQTLDELLADLRAMHGCLITGTLLLAPACDDLHQLHTHHQQGTTMPTEETPTNDLADQQRPAHPEPTTTNHQLRRPEDTLEANPADIADQDHEQPLPHPDYDNPHH
ncbi:hypothetical protein [Prauserella rugosa]|uniref:Uncharacterized protein n=1 Tax=Prauserella rugosa TaxID=43354 RepID=A0A660C3M1_9PSEU|nr:hypothetical protein [Prauserella rugosa]KMS91491.1 hypothetical protein ACZ91_09360 [Streptomyces regensis]TWH15966.1 hypothetical protein JD82_04954 [Prauserella rugosa]